MVLAATPSTIATTNVNAASQTTILQQLSKVIPLSLLWIQEQEVIGRRVARYRRYYDGDHDAGLTSQMRKLLRIRDNDDGFAANFMPTVVDTKADRCIVQSIEGIEDDAPKVAPAPDMAPPIGKLPEQKKPITNNSTTWAQDVMDWNNFDVIQGEVHENTIRDGNGYLMAAWDVDKKQICFTVEPAWDGQAGILMVYRSHNIAKPTAAIKIWQIEDVGTDGTASIEITTRCNIYYDNRVEKFAAVGFSGFVPFTDEGDPVQYWDMVDGRPIGIPVIHFRNGGRENYGVSELRNALGPQNALNRFHYSSVMAAELTAFAIYVALGFEAPDGLVPGMIVEIPGPIESGQTVDFRKLPPTDIAPILAMIDSERRLISEITRTPSPDLAAGSGSNKSGEYLKQLEVGLIGKVKRFTNRAGSSWEQVFDLAWRIQTRYGTEAPPPYKRFICNWRSPEIRNNTEVVANAMAAQPVLGDKQTMRNMAEVFELTEEKIEDILAEKQAAQASRVSSLVANMPGYGGNAPYFGKTPANGANPTAANPVPAGVV